MALSYKQIRSQAAELDAKINEVSIGTPEYYSLMQQRQELEKAMLEIERSIKNHTTNGSNYTGRIGDNL